MGVFWVHFWYETGLTVFFLENRAGPVVNFCIVRLSRHQVVDTALYLFRLTARDSFKRDLF